MSFDKRISYSYNTLEVLKNSGYRLESVDSIDVAHLRPIYRTSFQKITQKPHLGENTFCLVMIVKDEEKSIEKCLTSMLDIVSYVVICDTGSSDGTIAVIKNFLEKHKLAGKIFQREWVNFAHNRTEMVKLAKGICDFRIFIDADCEMVVEDFDGLASLTRVHQMYPIMLKSKNTSWWFQHIFRSDADIVFRGVLHEVPYFVGVLEAPAGAVVSGVHIKSGFSKSIKISDQRGKEWKEIMDIKLMRLASSLDPSLARRYHYHIAHSYDRLGNMDRALRYYKLVIKETIGKDQWVYHCLYRIARISEATSKDEPMNIAIKYLKAYEYTPTRLEPLYRAMRLLKKAGAYQVAFSLATRARKHTKLPISPVYTMVEEDIYYWKFLDEYSIIAFRVGEYDESLQAAFTILNDKERRSILPSKEIERIIRNFELYKTKASEETKKKILEEMNEDH